jgi:hypothetical protein
MNLDTHLIVDLLTIVLAGGGAAGILKLISGNWKVQVDELNDRVDRLHTDLEEQELRYDRQREALDAQLRRSAEREARIIALEESERRLLARVVELERLEQEQAGIIAGLIKRVRSLTWGVSQLIQQIRGAGLEPVWKPEDEEGNGGR